MPMFKVEYGMDVPAYGETLIHARSAKHAEAEARRLHKEGNLIDSWNPIGEMSEDHRVLAISRDCGAEWKQVSDGFPLDDDDPVVVEIAPAPAGKLLWIAYDPEQDRVMGHAHDFPGAVVLQNRYPAAKVSRVSL